MTFKCPSCGQTLSAKQEMAGRLIQCPTCGSQIQVPTPEEPPSSPPMPQPTVPTPYQFPAPLPQGLPPFPNASPPEKKGWWKSFCDFDTMVSETFIPQLWMILSVLFTLVSIVEGVILCVEWLRTEIESRPLATLLGLAIGVVAGVLAGIVGSFVLRLHAEFLVVIFKIHSLLKDQRDGKSV